MVAAFKGFFITLEGGEGSGKSTLINQLEEYLVLKGHEVVKTREPGGSQLGETIRKWLLGEHPFKIGSQAELLLFLAARAQHIEEVIKPALQAGKVVLCDRFNDSTIAYQGVARGLNKKRTKRLCNIVCESIQPQLTLFLDVDPLIGLQRTQKLSKSEAKSGELDRIEAESLDFHKQVRKAFLAIAIREPLRVYRINANVSQDEVKKEAIQAIEKLLLLPKKRR